MTASVRHVWERMTGTAARALLLAAIRAYKRHLSPRKGFACAYRVHTGRASCSTLGYRAVARHGVFRGLGILDARLAQCRLKHERYGSPAVPHSTPRLPPSQGGFVDCGGCDGCDPPSCDMPTCDLPACDLPGCHAGNPFADGGFCGDGGPVDTVLGCMPTDDCGLYDRWRRRRTPVRERGRGGRPVAPTSGGRSGQSTADA